MINRQVQYQFICEELSTVCFNYLIQDPFADECRKIKQHDILYLHDYCHTTLFLPYFGPQKKYILQRRL